MNMPTLEQLSEASRGELLQLQRDVQEALRLNESKAKNEARERIRAIAEETGFDISELVSPSGSQEKREKPVRFRDKNGNEWSGRGRQPQWIKDIIENGESIEDYRVSR